MNVDERMRRFTELSMQMKADPAVLSIVENWCVSVPCKTVGEMAQNHPDEFDFLIEAVDDFLEQTPSAEEADWMG